MNKPVTTFNVAEYAKALSKLPMRYLTLDYTELKHIVFQEQIIVAHGTYPPMIYKDQKWDEMMISLDHGMVIHDPTI